MHGALYLNYQLSCAVSQGNPLPLISGSNGNYSSAQILVTAGEYVGCQLALEQGDMLPVQAFMVTDRSHIVYIFPESSLGKAIDGCSSRLRFYLTILSRHSSNRNLPT